MNRSITGYGAPPEMCRRMPAHRPTSRPPSVWRPVLMLALLWGGAASAAAQVRNFPDAALRGTLKVTTPPDVELDGRQDRLSPGARIRNPQNMFMLSGTLVGQELVVNYLREPGGQISDVWLLSPDEAAVKRRGAAGRSWFETLFGL